MSDPHTGPDFEVLKQRLQSSDAAERRRALDELIARYMPQVLRHAHRVFFDQLHESSPAEGWHVVGGDAVVFERAKMLDGDTATAQLFAIGNTALAADLARSPEHLPRLVTVVQDAAAQLQIHVAPVLGRRVPEFTANMPRARFEAMVARIIEYVYAGDALDLVPLTETDPPEDAAREVRGNETLLLLQLRVRVHWAHEDVVGAPEVLLDRATDLQGARGDRRREQSERQDGNEDPCAQSDGPAGPMEELTPNEPSH